MSTPPNTMRLDRSSAPGDASALAETGEAPYLAFSSAPTCVDAEPGQQGAAPVPEEIADRRDTADAALAALVPAAAAPIAASAAPERLGEEQAGSSAAEEAAGSLGRTGAGADLQDPGASAARGSSGTGCGEADAACPDAQAAQPSVDLPDEGEAVTSAAAASERALGPSQAPSMYAAAVFLPVGGEQGSAVGSAPADCVGVSVSTAASVYDDGASAAVRLSASADPSPAAPGGALPQSSTAWSSGGAVEPVAAPDQHPAGAAEAPAESVIAQHEGAEAAAQPPAPRAASAGQHRVTFAGLPGEARGGGAAGEPAAGVHELLERADEERAALVAENGAMQQRIRQVHPGAPHRPDELVCPGGLGVLRVQLCGGARASAECLGRAWSAALRRMSRSACCSAASNKHHEYQHTRARA